MSARRPLRLGLVGLGQGAADVLPAIDALPSFELVAGADPNPTMREGLMRVRPDVRTHADAEAIIAAPDIDCVWIASPNRHHCDQAIAAMRAGKHVAVDKPMAVTLEEADRMVDEADASGVVLIAAHTESYRLPIRAMRRLALSGSIGKPRAMLLWSFTDWMLRPRTAEELAPESGGGIVHRQAPHQIDTVRLLGGGLLRSVRGSVGDWMPERAVPGFYNAFLEFEDGTTAVVVHDGYGYFMTAEMFPTAFAAWRYSDADRIAMRAGLRDGTRNEEREKEGFRIGGDALKPASVPSGTWSPLDLGMLVLSCERGDVRHSERGLYVYDDDGRHELDLSGVVASPIERDSATLPALVELARAIAGERPAYHDGRWGRATLEASLAITRSAHERGEIRLTRQTAMPDSYDDDLILATY